MNSLDSFVSALAAMREKFRWELLGSSLIRGRMPTPKCGCCTTEFCPITAVCRDRAELTYSTQDADYASTHIGLPFQLYEKIVRAADNVTGHDAGLRRRMLEALGLAQPTALEGS